MTNTKRPLRVFLCHASGDKPAVRKLYEHLVKDGIDAWLDKEKLIPGQNWQIEIPKAVKNSDVVIVCLSSQSVTKEGFVQKEIKLALDSADEKPDGTIFVIPARLEDCEVPERISKYQWVDLFSDDGYAWLIKALEIRALSVEAAITPQKKIVDLLPKAESHSLKIESNQVFQETMPETKYVPEATNKTLLDKKCAYFSREYQKSFMGKFVWLIEKTGDLRLTDTSLVFNSKNFMLDIPFERITSIETKILSRWAKPVKTAYIEINYVENKINNSFGLAKNSTIWESNNSVIKWIEFLEKVPAISSQIKYPLQTPLPSDTKRDVAISILIGVALIIFGFLVIVNSF